MTSRRQFLALAGATSLTTLLAVPRVSFAAAPTDQRFVFVVLRGGMDGLQTVPPYGDANYRSLRASLALNAPGTTDGILDLDGFYGFHPALAPVLPFYKKGELAIVHATATPYRDRSHFDGQDVLENGMSQPHTAEDGWVNRALGAMGASSRRLGLAVGTGVPFSLRGAVSVASYAPSGLGELKPELVRQVAALYDNDPVLASAFEEGVQAEAFADSLREADDPTMAGKGGTMAFGAAGMPRALVKSLATTAGRMLAAEDGPRVAVVSATGWDTHTGEGKEKGRVASALDGYCDLLTGLADAMAPVWSKTVILAASEFGRTAAPNGSDGTDHGTGGVAFLMGGAVAGGHVVARWPGLGSSDLRDGRDLQATIDLRGVYRSVLVEHLRLDAAAVDSGVLPGGGIGSVAKLIRT